MAHATSRLTAQAVDASRADGYRGCVSRFASRRHVPQGIVTLGGGCYPSNGLSALSQVSGGRSPTAASQPPTADTQSISDP